MPMRQRWQPQVRTRRGRNRHPSGFVGPSGAIVGNVGQRIQQSADSVFMLLVAFRPTALLRCPWIHGSMDDTEEWHSDKLKSIAIAPDEVAW